MSSGKSEVKRLEQLRTLLQFAALIRFGFSALGEPFGPRLVDSSVAKK